MKRILLVCLALVLVAGAGSAGAFFVHRALESTATAEPAGTQAIDSAPRDLTPVPIPVAARQDEPQTDALPPDSATPVPQREEYDRAADSRAAARRPSRDEDDIPDADQLPAHENPSPGDQPSDPFTPREPSARASSRYAEQQVGAEIAEPEKADEPAQAAPEVSDETPPVDRYGRPAAVPQAARAEPQPTAVENQSDEAETAGQDSSADATPAADDPQAASDEGTGRPGDPQLSGSQAPALTIEKTAPAEIQIGKAAKFVITVRNAGSATAQGVEIHDVIPQGTQLVETTPPAKRGPQGSLAWELGAIKPGEQQKVELQLMPTAEGEIGSVATVHFRAEASVRTVATKPMLNMEVSAPGKIMKGEAVALKIRVSNPGTGSATGVVISENVPEAFAHPAGKELELDVGTLKPGESRELDLELKAVNAGNVINIVSAQGDGNLQVEVQSAVEVVAPQLQVGLTGPKRRYLERNAVHNISVSNPGTATAKDIELVAVLPKELKFVEANNGGQFDAATHSVYWSLEELPPQETGTVTLTTLPLTAGEAKLVIKSSGQQNLADQREDVVTIEGLAAINFQLSDTSDPIEAGAQTKYEVRVTNQGSKAAGNVRLVAVLPKEMKALSAEGPVRYKIEGQRIVFEPLRELPPKADTSYSLAVQALQAGDLRLQVQITTDEIHEPITKEESTRVYGAE
ncbi:MAG TPA: hypothetical protein VHV08_17135 [Pirellulales bacterium]|nr:hypothetical protein [Pirellulales bacterium]